MKKNYLIVIIAISLLLNGCSLDGWDALGIIDGVVSTATGDNNSGPTPVPTKSPETIEKENKVTELLEQEFIGYDLAYRDDYKVRHKAQFILVDFDRQVKTTVTYEGDALTSSTSSYIVIKSEEIRGTMDTEWVDLYESTDGSLAKYAVYSRIIEIDGEKVIQDFQKYNPEKSEFEEKIIKTKKIEDLETYVEKLRTLLDKDSKKLVDKYNSLFPRDD